MDIKPLTRQTKNNINRTVSSRDEHWAWVAELVDARDLKSLEAWLRVGSIPTPGTNYY